MICFCVSYFLFIVLSTIENPCDEGIGAEDLEDPGYLADKGKQPFHHVWENTILHASRAIIPVAYDHEYSTNHWCDVTDGSSGAHALS